LVRFEQVHGRRVDALERARHPGPRGEQPGLLHDVVSDRVVGVERVHEGVREHDVGRLVAEDLYQAFHGGVVDLERVVAEVEAEEPRPYGRRGLLRLLVPDALDVLHRLPRLLPELARLAAFAVRERDDEGLAAVRRRDRDRAGGAPDEVGRVRAHDEELAGHQSSPTRRREFSTVIVRTSSGENPASRNASAMSASPSCTGGLLGWPRSLEITELFTPAARTFANMRSHVTLPLCAVTKQRSSRAPRSARAAWSSALRS